MKLHVPLGVPGQDLPQALFNSQVKEVRHGSVVLEQPDGTVEIPNDAVIVQIGGVPPFEMLKRMGIAFGGESLSVKDADRRCGTSASG